LYQKVIDEQSKQSDPTIQRKDNNRIPTENRKIQHSETMPLKAIMTQKTK
jgi:hypothetical protein